jgi:hypothetical protein
MVIFNDSVNINQRRASMKTYTKSKTILVMCLFAAVVGFSSIAHAGYTGWMFSHGNATHIETPANCTYQYFGWGLDLTQKSGLMNWIHMTVPTPNGDLAQAQYIRLKFYTGSADAVVSQIDVYNGNTKVKTIGPLSLSNGWKDLSFDLGSKLNFSRGMGISIKIGAGVESMNHRFIFSAAGGNFN